MASITITIPDAVVNDVLDAFAVTYGWTADSGLTKAQFARARTADYIKNVYKNHLSSLALQQAQTNVDTQVNAVVIT